MAPAFKIVEAKGLDEEQIDTIRERFENALKDSFNEEVEEDEPGLVFGMFEAFREILSEYNDTIKGRCLVCLEAFA